MKYHPVDWFEIPVIDLDRAIEFYSNVFGYDLTTNNLGPMQTAFFKVESGGVGATGALVKSDVHIPSHTGTIVYFYVESIDETLEKIQQFGGKTLFPKISIGEYGHIAHFEDTEGNKIALHMTK